MRATITIELDVRQWIEENDYTDEEAKEKIIEELYGETDDYSFGSFFYSDIKVEIENQ